VLTKKENLLRAIKRENPEWVPNGMENCIRVYPPILERTLAAGYDAWDVKWGFEEGARGCTFPAHGAQECQFKHKVMYHKLTLSIYCTNIHESDV
jgi:hypothetical protein